MQNEITKVTPLLAEDGTLLQRGYSKRMLLTYDRTAIKGGRLRIKEWDYYIVMGPSYAVALTVADNSYMGLHSVSLLDFTSGEQQTTSIMTFMPNGKTALPADSRTGLTAFRDSRINISFDADGKQRRLRCELADFKDGEPFSCDIMLQDNNEESMVIATPFAEKSTAFYYNQKINCMPASGYARYKGKEYLFKPQDSFGTLDWGRGVWTYKNTWYWSSASGIAGGERFGFNLGYGFGDTGAATENMLFYGGKAHKLDGVAFNIPLNEHGRENYLEPWHFTSTDNRLNLVFTPVMDRASKTSVIVIESDQHQVFGKFNGTAVLDNGTEIQVKDLMGFAEKVKNRW